jgi:arylsulfatase A-like enzyme
MVGTTINGSRNDPLRGSKRQTLEGGIRVPWIVQWKGRLSGGRTYDHPVIQLDILPTALTAAGVEVARDWKLDGVNLLPYFEGKNAQPPHETLHWRFGTQMAMRRGDWKLVQYDNSGRKLYNLAVDIGEASDLLAKESERAKEMEAAWQKWNAELAKPLWGAGTKAQEEE